MNVIIEFYQDLKNYNNKDIELMAKNEGVFGNLTDMRWGLAIKHSQMRGEMPSLPLPGLVTMVKTENGLQKLIQYSLINKENLKQVQDALPLLMDNVNINKDEMVKLLKADYNLKGITDSTNLTNPMRNNKLTNADLVDIVRQKILERFGTVRNQGVKEIYEIMGIVHRDGDEPAVIAGSGVRKWYKAGQLHRDNGPAKIGPYGIRMWYKNGYLYRDDGPAREYVTGAH